MKKRGCIPSQFRSSLPGLLARNKDTSAKQPSSVWLEDLLLWTVLMVQIVEPPAVFRIKQLLNSGHSSDVTIDEGSLTLFESALNLLRNRESPLYRSMPESPWPFLQLRFNVILMRFVFCACTQNRPNNRSDDLFEVMRSFFQSVAESTAQDLWWDVMSQEHMDPVEMTEILIVHWNTWEGITRTASDVSGYLERITENASKQWGYLERYYANNEGQVRLKLLAETPLMEAMVGLLLSDEHGSVPQRALERVSAVTWDGRSKLLLEASHACKTVQDLSLPEATARPQALTDVQEKYGCLQESLAPALERASAFEKVAAAQNQADSDSNVQDLAPVTIVSIEGTRFPLPQDSHFINSSGFLRNLHLRAGDTISLNVKAFVMEDAFEFYRLDEENPCPEIPSPLGSNDMDMN